MNMKGIIQNTPAEIEDSITKYVEKFGAKLTGNICPEEINEMLYKLSPLSRHFFSKIKN